jgi:phosphatidate cytidylyltransferase
MSPEAAFSSPVFRAYVPLIAAVLGLAGSAVGIATTILRRADLRSLWLTYRSWLVMAPLALACVFAGRVPIMLATTLVSMIAFREFARATALAADRWMTNTGLVTIVALGVTLISGQNQLFLAAPAWIALALFVVPILRDRAAGQLKCVSLALLGVLYTGWMLAHLGLLAASPHAYGYVLYLLVATELNDVAAFTFGRLLGRRPLRPVISPRKTWEGAIGALAVSMTLPWMLRFSFPHFGTLELVITGLVVGVGGQFGDLFESVIKRDIGIKDMGNTIPGHGGVLDRIDSLVFVAPLFFYMTAAFGG